MRVLMISRPFVGHVGPMALLARTLRQIGCSVLLVGELGIESCMRRCAAPPCELLELRLDSQPEQFERFGIHSTAAEAELLGGTRARMLVGSLRSVMADRNVDLVLRDVTEPVSLVVAESLGIPSISVGTVFPTYMWRLRRPLCELINMMRYDLGVPEISVTDAHRSYVSEHHLEFVHPDVLGEQEFSDSDVHFHFGRFERSVKGPPVSNDRTEIVVSLGSLVKQDVLVLRAARAIDKLGYVGHVSLNNRVELGRTLERLRNIRPQAWLPVERLLRSASLLITHGGYSTTREALIAGIPMLIAPQWGDQPDVARQCTRLGVAKQISAMGTSVGAMVDEIKRSIDDHEMRHRSAGIATKMAAIPPIKKVLECLLGD